MLAHLRIAVLAFASLSVAFPLSAAPAQDNAAEELRQLFADSDEAALKLNPIGALFRGDRRYDGEFGDYITDAYVDAQRRNTQSDLRRLRAIDRARLSGQDQIAYDVFGYQTLQAQRALAPEFVTLTITRPLDHLNGLHIQYPDMNSGKSVARFETVEDYENGLKRMQGFVVFLDRAIGRMREGTRTHVVETKLTVRNMMAQLDQLIGQGVEKSPFWQPIANMPKSLPARDRMRLSEAYRKTLETQVIPAYRRLRTFFNDKYLPVARKTVGLSTMRRGPKLYRFLVEQQTTSSKLTADQIHKIGLAEVARIKGEMEKVRQAVKYRGTLQAFFEHLRTAKAFEPKSAQELQRGYADIGKRIDDAVPRAFSLTPKTAIELRPVPDYLEQSQAGGYYNPGTPDGKRGGVFYFNTYDLPSRKTWGMETLYLHEAVPGHHFQISLAQENEGLPKFMRFGGNTAYVEGWALYSEWLGRELGMFKDPYQMFGHLNDEQLRAMRLVVDTGIHAKGWTRERAIKYMLDNSALSVTETTQEVERYIANPGQALGYKIGQLTIRRLREEADRAMGKRFDLRDFHAQVLNTGALPMEILEAKIQRWMKAAK